MNSGTDKPRKALGKGLSALLPSSRQHPGRCDIRVRLRGTGVTCRSTRSSPIRCSRGLSSSRTDWKNWRPPFAPTGSFSR